MQLERAKNELEAEHEKSESLLLNILPKTISERLKQGEDTIADEFETTSVLFTDLVGFTSYSERVSATELVNVLNEIFSEFDRLTVEHGLEKIKTIGDAYMAGCWRANSPR